MLVVGGVGEGGWYCGGGGWIGRVLQEMGRPLSGVEVVLVVHCIGEGQRENTKMLTRSTGRLNRLGSPDSRNADVLGGDVTVTEESSTLDTGPPTRDLKYPRVDSCKSRHSILHRPHNYLGFKSRYLIDCPLHSRWASPLFLCSPHNFTRGLPTPHSSCQERDLLTTSV